MGLAYSSLEDCLMSKGLWPAVSGSIAQAQRLEVVANNLANVNTAGFKRDSAAFRHLLSDAMTAAGREDVPRQIPTDKEIARLDGRDAAYVVVDGIHTEHSQGMAKTTGNPLDLLIEGKGFFEVLTPNGVRYTRQGNFILNGDGVLTTTDGYLVLSPGAATAEAGVPSPTPTREELASRAVVIDSTRAGQITVGRDGGVYRGREQLGQIGVVEFVDNRMLRKEGDSLFRNEVPANLVRDATASNLRQGMLETSNVNPVKELTDLLSATRMFEANQKIVKNYGEMEARAVNEIGKL
jgi:flagellar basal-body rod protein FlgG